MFEQLNFLFNVYFKFNVPKLNQLNHVMLEVLPEREDEGWFETATPPTFKSQHGGRLSPDHAKKINIRPRLG